MGHEDGQMYVGIIFLYLTLEALCFVSHVLRV